MENIVPKGFTEIARSDLPGTGGISATAYKGDLKDESVVMVVIKDPCDLSNVSTLGPFSIRMLSTIIHVLNDVAYQNKVR